MTLNIIHLPHRTDRMELLEKELAVQGIKDYQIWNGVEDVVTCRGIAKAHKQIVWHAKQEQIPMVLIAEDDVHFTAPGAFNYFIENLPNEFDIYLGGVTWKRDEGNGKINDFSGMTMYVVHERFYNVFLSLTEDKDIDRSLGGKGEFVLCNPMVVTQHNGYSDHQKRIIDLTVYFKHAVLFGGASA